MSQTISESLRASGITLDHEQESAACALGHFSDKLLSSERRVFWRRRKFHGIYLWGLPGRGKTMLMDECYSRLDLEKRRVHWHVFLQSLHKHRGQQARQGALHIRARRIQNERHTAPMLSFAPWIADVRLVCFDEFHISDPGNAVLLGQFIKEALRVNTSLVLTSNYAPDDLYGDATSRHLVQPMISLLKKRMTVLEVAGERDYRNESLRRKSDNLSTVAKDNIHDAESTMTYGKTRRKVMQEYVSRQGGPAFSWGKCRLNISGRHLDALGVSDRCLWVDFDEICATYRSYYDYIEIVSQWKVLALDQIPPPTSLDHDRLRRFIWLIDVVYDARTTLLLLWPQSFKSWLSGMDDHIASFPKAIRPDIQRCMSRVRQIEAEGPLSSSTL